MENMKKPDWFELADNDQPVARKVTTPKRNLAFILAGVLVLPMGAGWALLSHEEQSANAVETLNQIQDSSVASDAISSAPTQPSASASINMPTSSRIKEDDEDGNDDHGSPVFSQASGNSAAVTTKAAPQPNPESSPSNETILPPTQKGGDDDHSEKREHKKESKSEQKSDRDDEEDDD